VSPSQRRKAKKRARIYRHHPRRSARTGDGMTRKRFPFKVRLSRPAFAAVISIACRDCSALHDPMFEDFVSAKNHARETGHTVDIDTNYVHTVRAVEGGAK